MFAKRLFLVSLAGAMLSAACAGPAANAPTPTLPPPVVVVPTITLLPPAVATATSPAPSADGAATPAAAPTATEAPARYGPRNFPPNVNPLTGQVVSSPATLERIPIAVKISNFPRNVRPQSGLSLADVAFEHYAEGGLTRFTAVFLGNEAGQIGSIRSARLIDTVIPDMYRAMLVTSGSSTGTMLNLRRTNFYDRVVSEETGYQCPPLCRPSNAITDTNQLFASTADVWAAAAQKGLNQRQTLEGLAFDAQAPTGGTAINTVAVDNSAFARVEWRYDAATGVYTRWQEKDETTLEPHVDALTNRAITASNVVVLFANHVGTDIPEDYPRDNIGFGYYGLSIQLWGSGPAVVFRDGQMYKGSWVRFNASDMVGLVFDGDRYIPLKPGNTWFQLVGLRSEVSENSGRYYVVNRVPNTAFVPQVTATPEGYLPPETPTPAP